MELAERIGSEGFVGVLATMLCGTSETPYDLGKVNKVSAGSKVQNRQRSTQGLYGFQPRKPNRAVSFDLADPDRLYTYHTSDLLRPLEDTLGDYTEIVLPCGDYVKWTGIRKTPKRPRGVCFPVPVRTMYEIHFREIQNDGTDEYTQGLVGVTHSGRPITALVEGSRAVAGSGATHEIPVMAASILEDTYRAGSYKVEITDGITLVAPIAEEAYKDFFALRDAPLTPTGRRKALLHWVTQHKRDKSTGSSTVQRHLRGVESFTIDGLTVSISPTFGA